MANTRCLAVELVSCNVHLTPGFGIAERGPLSTIRLAALTPFPVEMPEPVA
jgi:hypothetical protein